MGDKAKKYRVLVQWSEEGQEYIAASPELGNCIAHGKSKAEAMDQCEKAIERFLAALEQRGLAIPVPFAEKNFSGKISLRIEPSLHRDIALKAEIEEISINQVIEKILRESTK